MDRRFSTASLHLIDGEEFELSGENSAPRRGSEYYSAAAATAVSPRAQKEPLQGLRSIANAMLRWYLQNTKKTVGEIAAEVGFADAAHFSRRFKLMFGESPACGRVGSAVDAIRAEASRLSSVVTSLAS